MLWILRNVPFLYVETKGWRRRLYNEKDIMDTVRQWLIKKYIIFFRFYLTKAETIGIRWDDVDLEKRVININHSLTYYKRVDDSYRSELRVSLPKTEAGIRLIPMMQPVYEVLKDEYDRKKKGFVLRL